MINQIIGQIGSQIQLSQGKKGNWFSLHVEPSVLVVDKFQKTTLYDKCEYHQLNETSRNPFKLHSFLPKIIPRGKVLHSYMQVCCIFFSYL